MNACLCIFEKLGCYRSAPLRNPLWRKEKDNAPPMWSHHQFQVIIMLFRKLTKNMPQALKQVSKIKDKIIPLKINLVVNPHQMMFKIKLNIVLKMILKMELKTVIKMLSKTQ